MAPLRFTAAEKQRCDASKQRRSKKLKRLFLFVFLSRAEEISPLPDFHEQLQHHRGEPALRSSGGLCRRGRWVASGFFCKNLILASLAEDVSLAFVAAVKKHEGI